jgi:hypothetical protein
MILNWYGGDFKKVKPIEQWINQYAPTPLRSGASITYMGYDWALNEQ